MIYSAKIKLERAWIFILHRVGIGGSHIGDRASLSNYAVCCPNSGHCSAVIHEPSANIRVLGRCVLHWSHTSCKRQSPTLLCAVNRVIPPKGAVFGGCCTVSRQKRMPERGLRPATTTNYDQWRHAIHIPSARIAKTGRVVQF